MDLWIVRIAHGTLHHELALRAVTAANILHHENVAFGNHLLIKGEQAGESIAIVAGAVRSARDQEAEAARQQFFGA